jgi:phosphate transport system substrate-binding protein
MPRLLFLLGTAIVALLGGAIAGRGAESVRIAGSDTMVMLNRNWAHDYARINPSVRVEVTGGGSLLGIESFLGGSVDIAAVSRPLTTIERSLVKSRTDKDVIEVVVAWDGLAIYVYETNPVHSFSMEELEKIFRGEIRNWKELGWQDRPIHLYIRNRQSGTHEFFKEHVLRGKGYAKTAQEVESTELLVATVARNQSAIGFGGIGYAPDARLVRITTEKSPLGIPPTMKYVATGEYPLTRPLYWYINPARFDTKTRQLIAWVLSDEGQAVVERSGFMTVDETLRAQERKELGVEPSVKPRTKK